MAFRLDMSKFKKISSDKDHTILQHDEGHQIKIAHSALSKENRKALEKLPKAEEHEDLAAEGGEVKAKDDVPDVDPKKAKEFEKGATSSGWDPKRWKQNLKEGLGLESEGGKVAMMAEGGDVKASDDTSSSDVPDSKPITINIGAPQQMTPVPAALQPGAPSVMAPQQAQQTPGPLDLSRSLQPQAASSPESNQFIAPQSETAPAVESQQPQQPEAPKSEIGKVQAQEEVAALPPGLDQAATKAVKADTPTPNLADAFKMNYEAAEAMGKQEAKLAKAREAQYTAQAEAINNLHLKYQEHYDRIGGEIKDVLEDIKNSHIDPNRVLGRMDTSQRMQTAIGLALSGFGSALTGGQNQAMTFLNAQIDRDIDAQKANLGKKESLVNAYYKEYGNLREAENMARLTMQAMTVSQLQAAEAKAQQPMAKIRAQQIQAGLMTQMAPMMQQQALNMMLMNAKSGQGDTEQRLQTLRAFGQHEDAKALESRYVPSVGEAKVPVPEKTREELYKRTNLVRATDNLIKWVDQHGGATNLSRLDPRVRAEGSTLARELQQIYRQGVGASTSEEEQKVIDSIVNTDPLGVMSEVTTNPKLKALRESMNNSLNTIKEQVGLPKASVQQQQVANLSPQQQSFVKWAKANPQDPRAKIVLSKLGLIE